MKKRSRAYYLFLCLSLVLVLGIPVYAKDVKKDKKAEEVVVENRLTIKNKRDFLEFAENCRLDRFSEGLIVSLEADIDLTGNEFEGVPIFGGMFEGNHHTISGLYITGEGSVKGLFRYLTEGAVVQNLSVTGEIVPQGSRSYIGSIAGNNAGTILNCNFSGKVEGKDYVGGFVGLNEVSGTIENCQTEGLIQGTHFVGGIAGDNQGVIRACSNLADVNTEEYKNSLEVSDITIETMTNSEATYTVTDVGGIAGSSSGVIKGCDNRGTIGYQHIGYNVGGIAGSQVGYIYDCENQGRILGRKEVGGIVGQMEPVANLEFSADTLQILEGQLGSTAGKIKRGSDRVKTQVDNSSQNLNSQIEKLQNDLDSSGDAVGRLLEDLEGTMKENVDKYNKKEEDKKSEDKKSEDDEKTEDRDWFEDWSWADRMMEWEDISLPDADNFLAARSSLNQSMSSMNDTLNSITEESRGALDTLTDEMQGIVNQAKSITSTVAHASDNIGISIQDVSDEDTDDNLIGKIEKCKNIGSVQADLNGGGILGVIALENDLDPEGELEIDGDVSLNLEGELRAVILDCENGATVTVRNQNGGGIVGWLSMGLVRDCFNTGYLDSANADYVGGIVGRSMGYIRNCNSKCEILGKSYMGGIAGSGTTVTDCRSMVQLKSGTERMGNILGILEDNYREEENPIQNNYYLFIEKDFGGIDGISYYEMAEPLDRDAFLNLENLPEEFWKVKVTFVQEDNSMEQVWINQGSALALDDIPKVMEKEGYLGSWEGLDETDISEVLFDLSFEALYTPVKGTIPSRTKGDGDKPMLLLQGDFNITDEVALVEIDSEPEVIEEQTLLKTFGFVLQDKEMATGARYLIPKDVKGTHLTVYVRNPESEWHETECSVDGSYLKFALKNGENQIAIVENRIAPSMWLGVAVLVCAIFVAAIVLERKHRG